MVPHILVIDDRISLPRFIALELHAEGYQVSINDEQGAELSTVRALKPNLIVLNWELRRGSGLNICRQLRLIDHQVPIVVVTAEDESNYRSALALGAQTCLTKPFSMDDLLKTIEYYLKCQETMLDCPVFT